MSCAHHNRDAVAEQDFAGHDNQTKDAGPQKDEADDAIQLVAGTKLCVFAHQVAGTRVDTAVDSGARHFSAAGRANLRL